MSSKLLLFLFIAGISFLTLLAQPSVAYAVGPLSDNSTADVGISGETGYDEIKPVVNAGLISTSAQPDTSLPSVLARLFVFPRQESVDDSANIWYLDIDVNLQGWLYIYERRAQRQDTAGRWIAYKWQVSQSGIWRLGPFTSLQGITEGNHTYQIWFFSNGLWPAKEGSPEQPVIIELKHYESRPLQTTALEPKTASASGKDTQDLYFSFAAVLLLVLVSLVILIAALVKRILWNKRKTQDHVNEAMIDTDQQKNIPIVLTIAAKLHFNSTGEASIIDITNDMVNGRKEVARVLDPDSLSYISREHIRITCDGDIFYIEDLNSANGTKLNGDKLVSLSKLTLKDKSVIDIAGVIQLTFIKNRFAFESS